MGKKLQAATTPRPWQEGDDGAVLGGPDPFHQVVAADTYVRGDKALIVRAVNAHEALEAVAHAAARLFSAIGDDLPCECYGQPDAIYSRGETCPPCELKAALKVAGREDGADTCVHGQDAEACEQCGPYENARHAGTVGGR